MRFRDDIDPVKTFVISDTHFGHRNIIEFCHRPDDFEQLIIENIAREVPDAEDVTLLHLGDLCYRNNAMFRAVISKHIQPKTGRKLLISGNHDRQRYSFYKQSGFKLARPFAISWGEWTVEFDHYASERPLPDQTLRLHGHIHNNGYTRNGFVPFLRNHVNLSVEQTKYKPVNLAALLSAVIDGRIAGDPDLPDIDTIEKENAHV